MHLDFKDINKMHDDRLLVINLNYGEINLNEVSLSVSLFLIVFDLKIFAVMKVCVMVGNRVPLIVKVIPIISMHNGTPDTFDFIRKVPILSDVELMV